MTAKIQEAEKQYYLDAGAIGIIEKPFEPMELGKILNDMFEKFIQEE